MSATFGIFHDSLVAKLIFEIREKLTRKGGISIRQLASVLRKFDFNGTNKLLFKEFENALGQMGLFFKVHEIQSLMKYFDTCKDGSVSYNDFLSSLIVPLSEKRMALTVKVFESLHPDEKGQVKVSEIEKRFNVDKHRDFLLLNIPKEEILGNILSNFPNSQSGFIQFEDFIEFYRDLSMGVADDNSFTLMMEHVWGIIENEDHIAFKQNLDQLINTIRLKLNTLSRKAQDEYFLRNIFREFNISQSGYISLEELEAMLLKLTIIAERKYLNALFQKFDQNHSGKIEFEEFCSFLISNPYTK